MARYRKRFLRCPLVLIPGLMFILGFCTSSILSFFYSEAYFPRREEPYWERSENLLPRIGADANTTSAHTTSASTNSATKNSAKAAVANTSSAQTASANAVFANTAVAEGAVANTTSEECRCTRCKEDAICGGLWHGKHYPNAPTDDEMARKRIHVVVSHCLKPLAWIERRLRAGGRWPPASLHVISKCNRTVAGAPATATVERLPNVGRCDHSYAHYLAAVLARKVPGGQEGDAMVLFLKDEMTRRNFHHGNGRWTSFERMARNAFSDNGFGCGIAMRGPASAYRHTDKLFRFRLEGYDRKRDRYGREGVESDGVQFRSAYKNLGAYYHALFGPPPSSMVPVCYGGNFAASVSNIRSVDQRTWERLERSLARGNNIEESHFAERSWASLLARPLPPFQLRALQELGHSGKRS
eukprot:CAMPEP_0194274934 /NCGR_PEP_ID=MMETSP0169-20130528/7896_1 /TAXON_ID=218684 /ORGANISM="Corethron pennatum, Strain L29A3" /LENGTH=412 /DNA_ID=CAMNT_0039018269 /DNA_START=236 /DNA_END=1474 /DNA_ORIENTATION=-